jgi:hypothetical protein
MISLADKTKQFLVLLIKLLVISSAFYFIYQQIIQNNKLNWAQFMVVLKEKQSVWSIVFILSLSVLNRYIEILKWQSLVGTFKKISLAEATKQVLAALTAGIFTPNGVGEYVGKALFFKKSESKNIVFLNLICNGVQMLLTVGFGILGLIYFNYNFNIIPTQTVLIILLGLAGMMGLVFSIKKIRIKNFSFQDLFDKINKLPKKIHQRNIFLGICRFTVFAHQHYFLLLGFGCKIPYFIGMAAILSMYFVASSLPSFQFLDFAIKGSVALFFFKILGVNEWIIVFVSALMWFLNIVIPVLIGSYFVMKYKPVQSTE